MKIEFTIPEDKEQRIVDALNGMFPQPEEGELTPEQWAKKVVGNFVISSVHRWEQKIAADNAARQVVPDSSLLT